MATAHNEPRIYGELTRYASVRYGFTQFDDWREALQDSRRGLNVPLRRRVRRFILHGQENHHRGTVAPYVC